MTRSGLEPGMRAMMLGWAYEWVNCETTMAEFEAATDLTWFRSQVLDWVPYDER